MAFTPVTVDILRRLRRKQGRPLRENAADIGIHRDREWTNSPCSYGCDCGECYSRSPDDHGPHHCVHGPDCEGPDEDGDWSCPISSDKPGLCPNCLHKYGIEIEMTRADTAPERIWYLCYRCAHGC